LEETLLECIVRIGEGHDVVLVEDLAEELGMERFLDEVVMPGLESLQKQKKVKIFVRKNSGKKYVGVKLL